MTPSSPAGSARPEAAPLREVITDAIRYWERGRVIYNAILLALTVATLALVPPRQGFHPGHVLTLAFLAVVANACYCAAYLPDVFVQLSDFRQRWRRHRWMLWASGTALASVLTIICVLMLDGQPW